MADMQATLATIWKRNIPQTQERLQVLERASQELSSTRTISEGLRAEAVAIAHKMAGSLGMFGLHAATDVAREMEQALERDGLPQPETLESLVARLRLELAGKLAES